MTKGLHNPAVDLSEQDITPISREKIETVHRDMWASYSISELHDELTTLHRRYHMMVDMDKMDIARQIANGIRTLESTIKHRQSKVDPVL